jgi:membrane fusion protein (multidrug efflux system)
VPPRREPHGPHGEQHRSNGLRPPPPADASTAPGDRKADVAPPPAPTSRNATGGSKRRGPLFKASVAAVALLLGTGGTFYWLHARQFESTDDAFVDGTVIRLAAQTDGLIAELLVSDNQSVRAGQLIARIDPADAKTRLDEARAQVSIAEDKVRDAQTVLGVKQAEIAQAQAQLTAAQADRDFARSEQQRVERIGREAASEQELQRATLSLRAAEAKVAAAEANVKLAEASFANATSAVKTAESGVAQAKAVVGQREVTLGYTDIKAPQAGRVTKRSIEVGSYVEPGQMVCAIVPTNVWVTANFKETQLDEMRPGQPVEIKVDAYPGHEFRGHVDTIQSGTGARFSLLPPENATGNFVKVVQRVPVKIVFDDAIPPDLIVAPGMSVEPSVKVK